MQSKLESFKNLLNIMDDLRTQCPWDMKQTIHSLRNLTIEETYELVDSIIDEDWEGIEEELGDLLLHIVFYAKIGEENAKFDINSIIEKLNNKMIQRHPHIYGDVKVLDSDEVKKNWEQLKKNEGKKSVLGGVPKSLPALIKAYRMQDKTAQVGFEWDTTDKVWEKVEEELSELKEVVDNQDSKERLEEEFGDVLFALVNYARFLDIDPETALEKTNKKFKRRFEYIEANATKDLNDMSLDEMDALWNEAKIKK
ncbi:MAG TPA: nucleoside triphosphate pyrophosphohydrolase [Bacteroidetes bacterium]|nr:nucleoside triphosphate pyrophosphohydrolase [Bacteroidota bacterium]